MCAECLLHWMIQWVYDCNRRMAGAEMLEKHYLGVRGFGAAIASFLALLVVLNR
jgi:hypothetical protein